MRRARQIHRYKSGARCTAINEAREAALPETTEVDEAIAASWVWWGLRARSEFSEHAFVLEPDRQSKSFVARRPCKASSGKVSTGRRRTFGILSRDGRSHVNDGDARQGPVAFGHSAEHRCQL